MSTAAFGELMLSGGILAAAVAVLACLSSAVHNRSGMLRLAHGALHATTAFLTLSSIALLTAIVDNDFHLLYVRAHSERALPTVYKLAAFWAGQEGSLLLWAWMLAVLASLAISWRPPGRTTETAAMTAVLAVTCAFFAALMLFAANPFARTPMAPPDGAGLNPLLQDPAMVLHPPLLFLGYAGYTVPFAMLLGALIAGRSDREWIAATRRWVLASWVFLTVGILLGAKWAYIELGWGGYWGWDPVENASLLPWLTGTALIHAVTVQLQRGMMKLWNAVLIALTFLLCIFATYLTRSGLVASVHGFEASAVGWFFLTFLVLGILVSAGLFLARRKLLVPEHRLEHLLSRESFVTAGNVLLVLIMLTTMVGTLFPVLSKPFASDPMTLGPPFFNSVVVPMALVLVVLMTMAPLMGYGASGTQGLRRRLILPIVGALVGGISVAVATGGHVWAIVAGVLVALAAVSIGEDYVRMGIRGVRADGAAGLWTALARRHRRWGALLAHLGMAMVVAGVAGSSLMSKEDSWTLSPGQKATLGRYTLRSAPVVVSRHETYMAYTAPVTVTDGSGRSFVLKPQLRRYHKEQLVQQKKMKVHTEVAVRSNVRDDVYLTLVSWQSDDGLVTLQARVKPLVAWLWLGGIALCVGAVVCMLPGRGSARSEAIEDPASPPSAL